ncbi:MAG: rubrerythrin family protein [Bacteroidetes bacterium]|nr:rubrerythrin family protein [Bacteroidota bacterium]
MKKTILILIALIFASGFVTAGNEKTIANLREAFKGESTASARYAANADQARKEGLTQIAILFTATSKAEAIHAANHKTVLEKLGQKVDPIKPEFTVKTTKENLEEGIKGESYEVTTMYAGFIETSKAEDVISATKSFRWASDTEKNHLKMYQKALDALNAKKTSTLPVVYWVCPKCGNTFDVKKPEKECPLCGTPNAKYIKFDK